MAQFTEGRWPINVPAVVEFKPEIRFKLVEHDDLITAIVAVDGGGARA